MTPTTEVLDKVEYSTALANQTSKREGRWSTPQEIAMYVKSEYGYQTVNVSNLTNRLEDLLKQERVEKKGSALWRIMKGGAGFGGDNASSTRGGGSPGGDYTPPEGQYTPPGQDPYYPPKDYPQDDPRNPNYRTTSPEGGGGAPAGGVGVPIPAPIGGVTEGVIRNLM